MAVANASTGTAIAHGGDGDLRVSIGIAVDLDAFYAFARENDIRKEAVESFFDTLATENVPLDQVEAKLTEIATHHLAARASLNALRPHAETGELQKRIASAFEAGRRDEARQMMAVYRVQRAANAAAAKLMAQREEAEIPAICADMSMVDLDYMDAAENYAQAVAALVDTDHYAATYHIKRCDALRYAGHLVEAIAAAQDALDIAAPDDEMLRGRIFHSQSRAMRDAGSYTAAARALRQARKLAAPDMRLTLDVDRAGLLLDQGRLGMVERVLDRLLAGPANRELAHVTHTLGRLYLEQGKWTTARDTLKKARKLQADTLPANHPDWLRATTDLARAEQKCGNLEEAEILYDEVHDRFVRVFDETHPEFATLMDHLGGLAADQGNLPLAETRYRRAIATAETALGADHPDLAQSWNNLGTVLVGRDELQAAAAALETACAIFAKSVGGRHRDYATALHNRAGTLMLLGQTDRAQADCACALDIRREILGNAHTDVATSLMLQANLRSMIGAFDDAVLAQAEALRICQLAEGDDHRQTIQAYADLARHELAAGQVADAMGHARKALLLARRLSPADDALTALAMNNLGHALLQRGCPKRALVLLRANLDLQRRLHRDRDHPDLLGAIVNLAAVSTQTGDAAKAAMLNHEVIDRGNRMWPHGHVLVGSALNNLGKLQEKTDPHEAARLFEQAAQIFASQLGPNHPHTQAARANHAQVCVA
ncbi:MAG: tetratricopeptide repeat protein [Pseudomonadota bacterium]